MTKKVDPKDLFYRYVDSVGRHLPRKRRDDIQMEIMSLLEDALEDRAQSEGRELDEEMVVEDTESQAHEDRSQSGQLFPVCNISNGGSGYSEDTFP